MKSKREGSDDSRRKRIMDRAEETYRIAIEVKDLRKENVDLRFKVRKLCVNSAYGDIASCENGCCMSYNELNEYSKEYDMIEEKFNQLRVYFSKKREELLESHVLYQKNEIKRLMDSVCLMKQKNLGAIRELENKTLKYRETECRKLLVEINRVQEELNELRNEEESYNDVILEKVEKLSIPILEQNDLEGLKKKLSRIEHYRIGKENELSQKRSPRSISKGTMRRVSRNSEIIDNQYCSHSPISSSLNLGNTICINESCGFEEQMKQPLEMSEISFIVDSIKTENIDDTAPIITKNVSFDYPCDLGVPNQTKKGYY